MSNIEFEFLESEILEAYRGALQYCAKQHGMTSDEYEKRMLGYAIGERLSRERNVDKIWESLSLEEKEELVVNGLCCC